MHWRTNALPSPSFAYNIRRSNGCCAPLFINRAWTKKNLMLEENKKRLILHTDAGRLIEVYFDNDTAILGKKVYSCARLCPCSLYHDSEQLRRKWQHDGDHSPTFFAWPPFRIIFSFHCSENRPQAKKISKNRRHYVESVRWIKCSFFERLGGRFLIF